MAHRVFLRVLWCNVVFFGKLEWRPLAEQGDAKAQFNLGLMYRKGNGVPQDHKESVKWSRKASEKGDWEFYPSRINRCLL